MRCHRSFFFAGRRFIWKPFWRVLTDMLAWRMTAKLLLSYGASVAFIVVFCLFIQYFAVIRAYNPAPDTDLWQINRPPSITFLDDQDNLIGTRGSHYGTPVPLDELPPYVPQAFIATEDRRFFRHNGFDPKGFTRAIIANIRARRLVQGGSTITQQLAKNLFLGPERTISRKIKELHLAFWIESRLSKEEILSLYLNRVYLGAGAFGIEAASNIYFSKSARDLTLAEAALLAGLPKAPTNLAPTQNIEGALRRSHEVLDNMVESGVLNVLITETAKLEPPSLLLHQTIANFGYFFDAALAACETLIGDHDTDIIISTTLNQTAQRAAIDAIGETINEEAMALNAREAALISFDNETGAIIAMMGGRNYDRSQFNRATQALRQPGSAFKPFIYLAGLENGLAPETLFVDRPIDVDGWRPRNYSGRYEGGMRLTAAFEKSVNTIAVQIAEIVGRDQVMAQAQKLGITRPLKPHPSLALGAMEVSLEEITAAYLPFARNGRAIRPRLITKIVTRDGQVLYDYSQDPQYLENQEADRLFDSSIARQMTYLMYQVVKSGTGRAADLERHTVVGKTGTTNDWRDAWFIGYSHHVTTGVWVGNDENEPMDEVTGGTIPTYLWRHYMDKTHQGRDQIRLSGAFRAPKRHDELRLTQLYDSLERDFARAQSNGIPTGASRPAISDPSNGAASDQDTEQPVQPKEKKKKRRRWFGIF